MVFYPICNTQNKFPCYNRGMEKNINTSISLVSHIHSLAAEFLTARLTDAGFPEFASSHGNILFQLGSSGGMTMSELSERINRDRSTVTVLVRKLEKEGLVLTREDGRDRRARMVFLTEKGGMYNKMMGTISSELIGTFYGGFSEEERRQCFGFLVRIAENFVRADDSAGTGL